jgi:hypothetical protein
MRRFAKQPPSVERWKPTPRGSGWAACPLSKHAFVKIGTASHSQTAMEGSGAARQSMIDAPPCLREGFAFRLRSCLERVPLEHRKLRPAWLHANYPAEIPALHLDVIPPVARLTLLPAVKLSSCMASVRSLHHYCLLRLSKPTRSRGHRSTSRPQWC